LVAKVTCKVNLTGGKLQKKFKFDLDSINFIYHLPLNLHILSAKFIWLAKKTAIIILLPDAYQKAFG